MSNDTNTQWMQDAKDQITDLCQEIIEADCTIALAQDSSLTTKGYNELAVKNPVVLRACEFAGIPYPKALEE